MSRWPALALFPLLAAGCAERPAPPIVAATPPAQVIAAPAPPDWRDVPETPGGWSYVREPGGSIARFGRGATTELEMRCDRATRTIHLSRLGGAAGTMTIKTSYAERTWPAELAAGRTSISLAAADPFLDQLAFSRGRFSIALDGLPLLMLPAWAEPSRVIEDCRL